MAHVIVAVTVSGKLVVRMVRWNFNGLVVIHPFLPVVSNLVASDCRLALAIDNIFNIEDSSLDLFQVGGNFCHHHELLQFNIERLVTIKVSYDIITRELASLVCLLLLRGEEPWFFLLL